MVETVFFTSGRGGTGTTVFEDEGTKLVLAGEQVTPEFGAFLTVGREAQGTFTVRDGADVTIIGAGDNSTFPGFQVGREDGGVGVLTVTGVGSTIVVDGSAITNLDGGETGFIRAGRDAGSDGTINVLDSAMMTNDPDGIFILAQNEGSRGVLNVDGPGSVFDFGATATFSEDAVGARGDAIITVSNGGRLEGGEIINNGILDVTGGGEIHANLIQDNQIRSSGGIEELTVNGDLTVKTSGFSFDFLVSDGVLTHDTYTATGDVLLEGAIFILATSPEELDGFAADLITGSTVTAEEDFSVFLVEFDGNSLMEADTQELLDSAANAVEVDFMVSNTALTVDFTGISDAIVFM